MSSLVSPHLPSSATDAALPTTHGSINTSLRFDWTMVVLYLSVIGGGFLDAWAHSHGRVDQTFFTPWHAVLYAAFALVALSMTATLLLNRWQGAPWPQALPAGYSLSLLCVLGFTVGGVGDLIWHELFGIEQGFDALFSPTHLLLTVMMGGMVTGPLRAAWRRPGRTGSWRQLGPAIFSLTGLVSVFSLLLSASHPFTQIIASGSNGLFTNRAGEVVGVLSILITTALYLAPILIAVRRWTLPPGALTVIWSINTIVMTVTSWQMGNSLLLPVLLVAAIALIDWLLYYLRPSATRPDALRLFAFAAPVLLFSTYFAALLLTDGIQWTIHLWTGATFLAGVIGWLLSYLVAPPPLPSE